MAPSIRRILRHPLVPLAVVALVVAGASAAAATNRLQIFQTERIAPLSFSTSDLIALPDVRAYGDLQVTGEPDVRRVDDAAAAARETGLEVPEVARLPRGVAGDPEYQVLGEVSAAFTFDAARAAAAAATAGQTLPAPPAGLDGSQVRLVAGPGVAQVWTQPAGVPSLIVGRAFAPTASSSGVSFEVVRDYLLSLPWLSEPIAAQLRAFAADGSTLPLPVPADRFTSAPTEIDGHPATLLTSRDRTMAAVVWVDNGVLTAVAGALDNDEVLSIARDLR